MRRIAIFGVILAVVAFVAAYLGSPYLAAHRLQEAARDGDATKLEQQIDFPAVRANLKMQVSAAVRRNVLGDSDMSTMGAAIAPAIIDQSVDALVTPDMIATMIKKGEASAVANKTAKATPPRRETEYIDLNHFRVTLIDPKDSDARIGMVFRRNGLFDWQLIRFEFPRKALDGAFGG